MRQREKPSKDVSKSAQRTNDNSPPIHRWDRVALWIRSPWNVRLNRVSNPNGSEVDQAQLFGVRRQSPDLSGRRRRFGWNRWSIWTAIQSGVARCLPPHSKSSRYPDKVGTLTLPLPKGEEKIAPGTDTASSKRQRRAMQKPGPTAQDNTNSEYRALKARDKFIVRNYFRPFRARRFVGDLIQGRRPWLLHLTPSAWGLGL